MSLSDVFRPDSDDPDIVHAIECGIQAFCCEKSKYHVDFLQEKAKDHTLHNKSRTYVMVDRNALFNYMDTGDGADCIIAAFFTIGISSILLSDERISAKRRKKLKTHTFARDDTIRCFVIGELCRSDAFSSTELPGLVILDECLGVIARAQDIVGGRIVLVDSRRKVLDSLYVKRGFQELRPAGSKTADGEKLLTSAFAL